MNISEYRNRNRKPITLPSGLKGWVRAPTIMDYSRYTGLLRGLVKPGSLDGAAFRLAMEQKAEMALRWCFTPEGGAMTEKEPARCLPGEMSIQDLDPPDAIAIYNAVYADEGPSPSAGASAPEGGKEAPGGAAFPDGAEAPHADAGPAGEAVRGAAPPPG